MKEYYKNMCVYIHIYLTYFISFLCFAIFKSFILKSFNHSEEWTLTEGGMGGPEREGGGHKWRKLLTTGESRVRVSIAVHFSKWLKFFKMKNLNSKTQQKYIEKLKKKLRGN